MKRRTSRASKKPTKTGDQRPSSRTRSKKAKRAQKLSTKIKKKSNSRLLLKEFRNFKRNLKSSKKTFPNFLDLSSKNPKVIRIPVVFLENLKRTPATTLKYSLKIIKSLAELWHKICVKGKARGIELLNFTFEIIVEMLEENNWQFKVSFSLTIS